MGNAQVNGEIRWSDVEMRDDFSFVFPVHYADANQRGKPAAVVEISLGEMLKLVTTCPPRFQAVMDKVTQQ